MNEWLLIPITYTAMGLLIWLEVRRARREQKHEDTMGHVMRVLAEDGAELLDQERRERAA